MVTDVLDMARLLLLADDLGGDDLLAVDVVLDVNLILEKEKVNTLFVSALVLRLEDSRGLLLTWPPVLTSIFSILPDLTSPPKGRSAREDVRLEKQIQKVLKVSSMLVTPLE